MPEKHSLFTICDLNNLQHLHVAAGENAVEFIDEKNKKRRIRFLQTYPLKKFQQFSFSTLKIESII